MSDSDKSRPAGGPSPANRSAAETAILAEKLDRVDELTSLLVDEVIDEAQIQELESLLKESQEGREHYVNGIQLHCDLMDYYGGGRKLGADQRAPVLGFLGDTDDSGVHVPMPPTKPGA